MRKFRRFVRFVSSFPFAGKLAIRPAVHGFFRAKPHERHGKMGWLSSLLGLFVFGHAKQAVMGISALRLLQTSALNMKWFWRIVFVGYTAANVAVTIVQIYLLAYCLYLYVMQRRTVMIGNVPDNFTSGEMYMMLIVTLGGQLLFSFGHSLVS